MIGVPIKFKDYLPLFYENISQLFFSQEIINILNEKYGEINGGSTQFDFFSYTTYYLKNSNKIKNYEIIDYFRNTTKLIIDFNFINDYINGVSFLPLEVLFIFKC